MKTKMIFGLGLLFQVVIFILKNTEVVLIRFFSGVLSPEQGCWARLNLGTRPIVAKNHFSCCLLFVC